MDGQFSEIEADMVEYVDEISLEDVPDRVVNRAKLVILDTIGVCIYGSQKDYIKMFVETMEQYNLSTDLPDGSTTFANWGQRQPSVATLSNSAGGTTLELDEGHEESGHMAIHIIPPALAIAEQNGSSGQDLLEAIISSYECSARVGDAIRPQKAGLHPHGTWSAIGSALAVGKLINLQKSELRHAINIASNPYIASNWLAALEGDNVRNFYPAIASQHGLMSAILAKSGIEGVDNSIERCMFPRTAKEDDSMNQLRINISTLNEKYYLNTNYFKVHACCRSIHSSIEALEYIMNSKQLDPKKVKSIKVITSSEGEQLDCQDPQNDLQAKFSIPYALAARAITGESGQSAYTRTRLIDPQIKSLSERVEIIDDSHLESNKKLAQRGAKVTVQWIDGKSDTKTVNNARGGNQDPYSDDEIREKFRELIKLSNLSFRDELLSIEEFIFSIESVEDISKIFPK